jgi:hypothetical protein
MGCVQRLGQSDWLGSLAGLVHWNDTSSAADHSASDSATPADQAAEARSPACSRQDAKIRAGQDKEGSA